MKKAAKKPATRSYAKIFAIIKQINSAGGNVTYQELVYDFTNERTTSLSSLKFQEYQEFERQMMKLSHSRFTPEHYKNDPLDKARKAIIAQFKSIGRTADEAKAWCEKYGVNKVKKKFNDYDGSELWILRQNAEKVKADFIEAFSKSYNMAYTKENKLKRIIDVKNAFKKLYKPGMSIEYIYEHNIYPEFKISRSTFYVWINTDAERQLKDLQQEDIERKSKFRQLDLFAEIKNKK